MLTIGGARSWDFSDLVLVLDVANGELTVPVYGHRQGVCGTPSDSGVLSSMFYCGVGLHPARAADIAISTGS